MRSMFRAALIVALLGACNQPQDGAADPNRTPWGSIDASALHVSDGVSYTISTVDGAAVADISNVPDVAKTVGIPDGVSIRLPDELEAQASGRQVSITVRAMTPSAEDAVLGVAYSTAESGNSGWKRFTLSATPRDYTFVYDVPPMRVGRGDFLGLRSYGDAHVQVLSYRTEVMGAIPLRLAPAAAPQE